MSIPLSRCLKKPMKGLIKRVGVVLRSFYFKLFRLLTKMSSFKCELKNALFSSIWDRCHSKWTESARNRLIVEYFETGENIWCIPPPQFSKIPLPQAEPFVNFFYFRFYFPFKLKNHFGLLDFHDIWNLLQFTGVDFSQRIQLIFHGFYPGFSFVLLISS